ncbi:hypothetical protein SISNIDRAFT_458599 [Sistotremastrum niveocremeum HHB9708]|nr:hypothetical protein SISNIDRAFT_458599 [Sistotremastrum niveocremeum HHB9708]
MTRITAEQESRMANWTSRIPGDEEHYIISLDFFHQMHCLNLVRKALWPEKYGPMELGDPVLNDVPFDHVDHCVNIIRENLMCNADITPNVYRWDADRQVAIPHFDVLHTCRSLDSINQWAVEHQLLEKWDPRKPLGTGS